MSTIQFKPETIGRVDMETNKPRLVGLYPGLGSKSFNMETITWYKHQNGIAVKSSFGKKFYIGYSLAEVKRAYKEKHGFKRAQWLQLSWNQMYFPNPGTFEEVQQGN